MADIIEFPIEYILCCNKCKSNYMLIFLHSRNPEDFAYTKCGDCGNISYITQKESEEKETATSGNHR